MVDESPSSGSTRRAEERRVGTTLLRAFASRAAMTLRRALCMGGVLLALGALTGCGGRSGATITTAIQGEPIVGVWLSAESPAPSLSRLEIQAAPGHPEKFVVYNESGLTSSSVGPTLVPGEYIHRTGDLTSRVTATYKTDSEAKSYSVGRNGLLTVEYYGDARVLMVCTFRRR